MKRLLIYLFGVFLGVVILDVACRLIVTPLFDNPPANTKASATYKFVSCKEPANVIILGASRANHHYISQLMEDSLGVPVYNYGWDGRCTLYQYLCLLRGIENGSLNTVILDISEAQFSKEWVDDRISDLYPYYWKNDTVKMMVNEVEKKNMSVLMLSSLIQYNSQYLNMVAPMANFKGYTPLPYTGKPLDISGRQIGNRNGHTSNFFSDIAINYFVRMADICRKNSIQFYVCLSPSLSITKDDENYIERLCLKNEIECWNLTNYLVDPILFSDATHLNDEGAKLFTQEIIKRLILKR